VEVGAGVGVAGLSGVDDTDGEVTSFIRTGGAGVTVDGGR
jgi:hypothetical protein